MAHLLIGFMRLVARWPLPVVRALGTALGAALWVLAPRRRHIALVNLRLCWPELDEAQRRRLAWKHFLAFGRAVMDRSWLWHADKARVAQRLQVEGDVQALSEPGAVVVFAPHFVGLDAGGVALTFVHDMPMASIYVPQSGQVMDEWVRQGRNRAGHNPLYERHQGVKAILAGLRQGQRLYLLPDMDFGPSDSVFVPFFGVSAATLPSLSRFARLGRARVVSVISRMTPQGYRIEVSPVWTDFPSDDLMADTARMNALLEGYIRTMPEQYHWVHRRFKTRPEGQPGVY
ncbi:MAG: lysophospholipid acyltransferase family protein [Limnohabitans sp.]